MRRSLIQHVVSRRKSRYGIFCLANDIISVFHSALNYCKRVCRIWTILSRSPSSWAISNNSRILLIAFFRYFEKSTEAELAHLMTMSSSSYSCVVLLSDCLISSEKILLKAYLENIAPNDGLTVVNHPADCGDDKAKAKSNCNIFHSCIFIDDYIPQRFESPVPLGIGAFYC